MRIKSILFAVFIALSGHAAFSQQTQVIIRDPNNASQQAGVSGNALNVNVVSTSGTSAPSSTATKTLIASTNATGTIPTGFISAVLVVGTGASVTIDGIPLVAGQSVTYNSGPKLHAVVNWTSLTGGTLYGWYEN